MPMTPPPPLPVDADDLEHVGPGAVRGWPLRASDPMREHPARAAVAEARRRDAQGGPPAADDLPRRSDGEGDVLARGHDGDGRAHPRPDALAAAVTGPVAGLRALSAAAAVGEDVCVRSPPAYSRRDERGQRRRRPAHPDARGGRGGRPARRTCPRRTKRTRRNPTVPATARCRPRVRRQRPPSPRAHHRSPVRGRRRRARRPASDGPAGGCTWSSGRCSEVTGPR